MSVSQDLKQATAHITEFERSVVPLLKKRGWFQAVTEADRAAVLDDKFWSDFRRVSRGKNTKVWFKLENLIKKSVRSGGKAVERSAGVALSRKSRGKIAEEYLQKRGGTFIKQVTKTDIKSIKGILADDWHMDEKKLGKRISKSLSCSPGRGRRIARTERHTAREWGGYGYAEELEMDAKIWQTVGDDRVRSSHQLVNREIALIRAPFSNGRMVADEIMCRCRILYKRKKKIDKDLWKHLQKGGGQVSELPLPGVPISGFPGARYRGFSGSKAIKFPKEAPKKSVELLRWEGKKEALDQRIGKLESIRAVKIQKMQKYFDQQYTAQKAGDKLLGKALSEKINRLEAQIVKIDLLRRDLPAGYANIAHRTVLAKLNYPHSKNLKAASAMAQKKKIAQTYDFKGLDPRVVDEWSASMDDAFKQFPKLREGSQYTGTMQAKEAISYEARIITIAERYGLSLEDARKALKKGRVKGNLWAESDSGFAGPVKGISINKKHGKNYDKLWHSIDNTVSIKWHPEGCQSLKGIVDHELGHQLDGMLGISKDPLFRAYCDPLSGEAVKSGLSEYARTNRGEFIAEAWAEYKNSPFPRAHAQFVGELIESKYEALK